MYDSLWKASISYDRDERKSLEFWKKTLEDKNLDPTEENVFIAAACAEKGIEFKTKLIPYKGNDSWVEPTLMEVKETLLQDSPPDADPKCSYCAYVKKTLMI